MVDGELVERACPGITSVESADSEPVACWRLGTTQDTELGDDFLATTQPTGRDDLRALAHDAMIQRGLLPDFSSDVIAETSRLTQAAAASGAAIRDLRRSALGSIDNDDSRDLDQLSVAEPLADGAVKILVAIADVDALVKKGSAIDGHARTNTTSVYTAAEIFPMLPEKLSTDLTSLAEGEERLAIVIEMTVARRRHGERVRHLPRPRSATAPSSPTTAWPPGSRATRAARRRSSRPCPGLDEQLRIQDRVAQALRQVRHEHGALQLETLEVRAVFDGGALTRPAARREESRQGADRGLHGRGQRRDGAISRAARASRRCGACCARRSAGTASSRSRRRRETSCRAAPDAVALDAFLARRRQADPARFPDLSLAVIKLLGSGEYVLEVPGQAAVGALRAGGEGLHAFHRAEPALSRPHHAAPAEGGARRAAVALLECASCSALAQHCTAQEDNADKVERQVGKSAAALLLASRIGAQFDAIVTGASDKGTWVRISGPMAEGRIVRGFEGLDVGDRVRVQLLHTDVERGFIDFATVSPKHMSSTERPPTPLAYKNERFLDSDDARPLRILAEYLEPMQRLSPRTHPRHHRVLRLRAPRSDGPLGRYYDEARELARLVTVWSKGLPSHAHRYVVCTGGGGGIMEAANRGASDAGRQDHRPQHRLAARAAAQSVHHARAVVRVPLLLHAQALVRASGARAGRVPGRLRHARRVDRDPDADADAKARPPRFPSCSTARATGTRSSISRRWSATA